jgi:ABC-type polysaccharide/polyol phosphate export permease
MRKKVKRKSIVFFFYIMISICIAIVLPNHATIKNRIEQHPELAYNLESMNLIRFNNQNNNMFLTEEDSYIEIQGIGSYISTIDLDIVVDETSNEITPQIFWINENGSEYSELNSISVIAGKTEKGYRVILNKYVEDLRIDIVNNAGSIIEINNILLNSSEIRLKIIYFIPYLIIAVLVWSVMYKNEIFYILYVERNMLVELVKNDMKSKYAGSVLGIFWAFIQPILTIVVMWFVFQVGFRNSPVDDIQFILWFSAGYIPWMFLSESITTSTNCLAEYSYLVKKIKFNVEILPVIKVVSSGFVNVIFLVFLIFMFLYYGHMPNVYWVQMIYYWICSFIYMLSLAFLLSAISVFLKDFLQIISVILQLLFWISPIIWSPENMTAQYLPFLKINPFYYILQGYRESLIYNVGFWEHPYMMIYFWLVVLMTFYLGTRIFKKLKIHFSDLL